MRFEPEELIEKLVALVPPPRFNLVRYHGVFAPRSAWRSSIIPRGSLAATARAPTYEHETQRPAPLPAIARSPTARARPGARPARGPRTVSRLRVSRYYTWAELMRRVFAVDVLECAHCRGRLRILAAIHPPRTTRAILEHLGLPSRAPPVAAARVEEELPLG